MGGRAHASGWRAWRPPLRGQRRPLPPRYRGWGGGSSLIYPTLYPAIYPTIYPEPDGDHAGGQTEDPDQGPEDGRMQDEVPPILAATLGRVPGAAALRYHALGPIAQAVNDGKASGPGLYLIEFDTHDGRRAYSGQTDDLQRRLKQHQLCGTMMGLDMRGHAVYVAPLASAAQRRSMEKSIHSDMFAHRRGVLTNQRRELELAVLGEMWA